MEFSLQWMSKHWVVCHYRFQTHLLLNCPLKVHLSFAPSRIGLVSRTVSDFSICNVCSLYLLKWEIADALDVKQHRDMSRKDESVRDRLLRRRHTRSTRPVPFGLKPRFLLSAPLCRRSIGQVNFQFRDSHNAVIRWFGESMPDCQEETGGDQR